MLLVRAFSNRMCFHECAWICTLRTLRMCYSVFHSLHTLLDWSGGQTREMAEEKPDEQVEGAVAAEGVSEIRYSA